MLSLSTRAASESETPLSSCRMGLNGVEWYVPLPARPYLPPAVFLPPLVDSKPSIRFVIALRCIDDGIFTYFVECVHINNDGGGGGVFSFARYLHLTVKLARHLLDSLRASPEHHELAHLHIPHPYQVWLVGRKRAAVLVLELLRYAFDTPRILADPILHDCLDLKLMERQTLLELAFQMHVSRQRLAQVRHKAMRQMRTVVHAMHIHDWEYASVAARLMELRHMYDCSQPLRLPLVIFDHDMEFHILLPQKSRGIGSGSGHVVGPGGKLYYVVRDNWTLVDATSGIVVASIVTASQGLVVRRAVPCCMTHVGTMSRDQSSLQDVLLAMRCANDSSDVSTVQLTACQGHLSSGLVLGLSNFQLRKRRHHSRPISTSPLQEMEWIGVDAQGLTYSIGTFKPSTSIDPLTGAPPSSSRHYTYVVCPGHDLVLSLATSLAIAQLSL
ncbi:unnamed protein product [Aphanomyces euteiches]